MTLLRGCSVYNVTIKQRDVFGGWRGEGGSQKKKKEKKKRIQALQQSAVRWVKAACFEDFCFVELIIQDRHDGLSQKGFTQAFKCTLKKKKKNKILFCYAADGGFGAVTQCLENTLALI